MCLIPPNVAPNHLGPSSSTATFNIYPVSIRALAILVCHCPKMGQSSLLDCELHVISEWVYPGHWYIIRSFHKSSLRTGMCVEWLYCLMALGISRTFLIGSHQWKLRLFWESSALPCFTQREGQKFPPQLHVLDLYITYFEKDFHS